MLLNFFSDMCRFLGRARSQHGHWGEVKREVARAKDHPLKNATSTKAPVYLPERRTQIQVAAMSLKACPSLQGQLKESAGRSNMQVACAALSLSGGETCGISENFCRLEIQGGYA